MPEVSVVISTYNSDKYITKTVESVLAQTFKDYELIVVDDGSTDQTRQLLEPYQDRLTYIYQENQKYSGARNTGIRAATGNYIAFLDSDDLWCPEKLECQVAVMEQYPGAALVHCQAAYIDPQGNPISFQGKKVKGPQAAGTVIEDQTRELFLGAVATTSTIMVRRGILSEVGPFDHSHIHGEDWELWVRLASRGPFAYIPKPLVKYRFYGWHKILAVESSEAWVADQFRTIERASALWSGDVHELHTLRSLGTAMIYIRAALANFHLARGVPGQSYLEKALAADPTLSRKERLVQVAVDQAKAIEEETGSYEEAKSFIYVFFSNLPALVAHLSGAYKEAIGWLYIGDAFKYYHRGDKATVRRLLVQGITQAPICLKNRGVISLALEAWLGKSMANKLRLSQQRMIDFGGSL